MSMINNVKRKYKILIINNGRNIKVKKKNLSSPSM